MKRAMVDVETLSTHKHAAVIAVGVAVFDDTHILDTNGWAIQMETLDGHIDPGAIAWWMKQSAEAREFSFSGTHHAISVASELRPYIVDADEVWANDPDFDLVVLQNWWERMPRLGPWPVRFRKYRSVRTMMMLAKRYSISTDHVWTTERPHHPVEDSAQQARAVLEVLGHLDRKHPELLR